MLRTLEPELMNDEQQALVYARADFSSSNQWYVDHLVADYPDHLGRVIDIGCGPGDVMVRLAAARSEIEITAVDGSGAMIALARQAARAADLQARVAPMQGRIPGLALQEHSFDAVLSKDLLHHLPEPMVLWNEAKRLGRAGAAIYVMDLIRPATVQDARSIVEAVAPNEHSLLKEDFYNSLCAAFTVEEARIQIKQAALSLDVIQVSDRHMLIKGVLGAG